MRIRLRRDVPVAKRLGLTAGRVFEVLELSPGEAGIGWWVEGDTGEPVGMMAYEAEVVGEGEDDDGE